MRIVTAVFDRLERWGDPWASVGRGLRRWYRVLRITLRSFGLGGGNVMAAAMAFYAVICLAPFGILAAAALKLVLGSGQASYRWLRLLAEEFGGQAADEIVRQVQGLLSEPESHLAGFGVLVLIWAALRLFDILERSLRRVWPGRGERGLVKQKLVSLAMMLVAGALLGTFVLVYVFIGVARQWLVGLPGVDRHTVALLQPRALLLGQFLISALAFGLVYKFVPGRHVPTRAAVRSGVTAAILWLIASPLFTWLMARSQQQHAMYGGLAGVVIFGMWAFLGARILMFGAHFTIAYEHVFVYDRDEQEDEALIERTLRRLEVEEPDEDSVDTPVV